MLRGVCSRIKPKPAYFVSASITESNQNQAFPHKGYFSSDPPHSPLFKGSNLKLTQQCKHTETQKGICSSTISKKSQRSRGPP